jgi:acyl-CoA thioester hydrolase
MSADASAGADAAGGAGDPSAAADFPVHRRLQTRWSDNDVYGHLNNVAYYSLFDTAINGWLIEAAGVDVRLLPAIGVVAETSCRFLGEVGFPDELVVGLALERRGRSSVIYRTGVFRDERGAAQSALGPARALGRFVHVYVDALTRTPVEIPAEIGAALEAFREPLLRPGES